MSHLQTTTAVARERAQNTLLQGIAAAAIMGAATGALDVLHAGHFTWRAVGISTLTAALMSVLAYLQHAYAAPYLRIRKQIRGDRR